MPEKTIAEMIHRLRALKTGDDVDAEQKRMQFIELFINSVSNKKLEEKMEEKKILYGDTRVIKNKDSLHADLLAGGWQPDDLIKLAKILKPDTEDKFKKNLK